MGIYNQFPLKELIIHPRIQKDFYKNQPNLEVFAEALSESRNPVVYNGDLFSAAEYGRFKERFPQVETVMLGRGLIRNPALAEELSGAGEAAGSSGEAPSRRQRLRAFHDELLSQYVELMSGDRNVLFKMKDLWGYMLAEFPDCGKLEKKLKKSAHLAEYRQVVDELFREV